MNKVSYIHYRTPGTNTGGFTVAFTEKDNGIDYAIAECSWTDNFNKKLGRDKASGRLSSNNKTRQWRRHIDGVGYKEFKDLVHNLGYRFIFEHYD